MAWVCKEGMGMHGVGVGLHALEMNGVGVQGVAWHSCRELAQDGSARGGGGVCTKENIYLVKEGNGRLRECCHLISFSNFHWLPGNQL